jgi:DNA replication protein
MDLRAGSRARDDSIPAIIESFISIKGKIGTANGKGGGNSMKGIPMGLQAAFIEAIAEGSLSVPSALIRHYPKIPISEAEAMLFIHLLSFIERERNDFPTIEQLQSRMSAKPDAVISMLQRMMKLNLLAIDEGIDAVSGMRYERYNLSPLFEKLASLCLEEGLLNNTQVLAASTGAASVSHIPLREWDDIFTIFEKEFARPLTPMELETISSWLDADQYKEELILAALKEAVFAGKLHFRYIDRILLEWSRNRVFTAEQAKAYAQRFRGAR